MARTNLKAKAPTVTNHHGTLTIKKSAFERLERTLMTCLLWEKSFYEDGQTVAERIASLIPEVEPEKVAMLAIYAREEMKLRHAPLLVAREMARKEPHNKYVAWLLPQIIQRADELTEFLSIYWKDGRCPLSAQVKKGLAAAFTKFSAYDLAKYNRDNAVKLRDVMFLVCPKPLNKEQAGVWKKLVDGTLESPDTWEVALSAGKGSKLSIWQRLLTEKKLGGLALLRNLRNMQEAGVHAELIRTAILSMKTDRILPFRFISAARHAPKFEPELETSMMACLAGAEKLKGTTALLIDVSGSMDFALSNRPANFSRPTSGDSDPMTRLDAACALAILLREICPVVDVMTFSERVASVPARRGFALRDAIVKSQHHSGTYLGRAIQSIHGLEKYDRLIVITDEQSSDAVHGPRAKKGYMVNVANYENGVGFGQWTNISGWSENIVRFIAYTENKPQ